MATVIRPISHEDRLSLVDHLDELRGRLIVSAIGLAIAFGICLWQNHALLDIINEPLKTQTKKQVQKGQGTVGQAVLAQRSVLKATVDTRAALELLSRPDSGLSPSARAGLRPLVDSLSADVARLPRRAPGDNPVTLGVGEPFTTTITVSLYFALVLALPLILYEIGGFVLPALRPNERRAIFPLLGAVPVLFVAGAVFGYFIVLPAAVRFFVNFNSGEFNVLVQASQFYKFAATILLAMGVVFQVPVVILGLVRAGIVTPAQLRKQRRYAIVACAVVAAFLPGDLITLVLETVPLYMLYEASILVASLLNRSASKRTPGAGEDPPGASRAPAADSATDPTVQQIIDHVDHNLSD